MIDKKDPTGDCNFAYFGYHMWLKNKDKSFLIKETTLLSAMFLIL